VIPSFQFVLSTGAVIDSLSVTGNLFNAKNLEVPEKTVVMLHSEMADSAVTKHIPMYITRLDAGGYFRFNNVRPGKYKIYGLRETDNSNNYNLPEEEFAFMDSTILVTTEKNYIAPVLDTVKKVIKPLKPEVKKTAKEPAKTQKNAKKEVTPKDTIIYLKGDYSLYLFLAEKKAHYMISSKRETQHKLVYALSLPPDTMHFSFMIPGASSNGYTVERSKSNDTMKVWLTDSTLYKNTSLETILNYPFTDTLGNLAYKNDTVTMKFIPPKATRGVKKKKETLKIDYNVAGGSLKPGQSIAFTSQTPLRQPDTTKIRLYEVQQAIKKSLQYNLVKDSLISTRYILRSKFAEGKNYLLVADSASFRDIFNLVSDSIGVKFSVKLPDTYSKLTLNIKNYKGDRIIQLLDKTEKLVAEKKMKTDGKAEFTLIDPGTYRIKVIYDINGDGKWTTGDFSRKLQPEPVSYYNADLELKANWALVQDWDIGVQHTKAAALREKKRSR
jgi:hypothetical protein